MTRTELLAVLRRLIGRPPVNQTSNEELTEYWNSALEWLAGEIPDAYRVRTDSTSLVITAGQREFPLPEDLIEVVWVEWNGNRLEPRSVWEWDRLGTDYVGGASGNPSEFAVQGRNLILYPPPTAAAVTTAGVLVYRYISSGEGLTPAGIVGLSDADQRIAAYRAAWEYLLTHPSETNQVLAQNVGLLLAQGLPQAQRRAADVAQQHATRFFPLSRRQGSVR